jgi:hypothetical protein
MEGELRNLQPMRFVSFMYKPVSPAGALVGGEGHERKF